MPGAERRPRFHRMPSRLRPLSPDHGTRRSCAVLLPASRSARSRCSAGSRRDKNRASRTRSPPPQPWSLPVQLTLHALLKKIACQHQRGSAGAELRGAAGRGSQDGSHRLGGNAKNLGELSCDHLEGNLIVWLLVRITFALERPGDVDPIRAPRSKNRIGFVDFENKRRSSSKSLTPSLENQLARQSRGM